MGRKGKIARLPKPIREELNRRLCDGEPGAELAAWLNRLPEVQRLVAAEFGNRPIREQNLSEWKQAGYGDWLQHQEAVELLRTLDADGTELQAAAGAPLTEKLSVWLTARYAVTARKLTGGGNDGEIDWEKLRALCHDVVALRRGDHSAARLKIEQELLDRGGEKTEEDLIKHFKRWATLPSVREWICQGCASPEEREQRLRQVFGLPPGGAPQAEEKPPQNSPSK